MKENKQKSIQKKNTMKKGMGEKLIERRKNKIKKCKNWP